MSKIQTAFVAFSAMVVLLPFQGMFLTKDKTEDFRPILERWENLKAISIYSESPPRDVEEYLIDQEPSISRIEIGLRNKQTLTEISTTIVNHLLNLEGGTKSLKPLSFTSTIRYLEMQKERGIFQDKFPDKIFLTLEIVSAFKPEVHTADNQEADNVLFFQAKVSMIVGTTICVAGSPELWKFDGESFHLLRFADSWVIGQ